MADYTRPRFPRKPFNNKAFGNKGGFDRGPREMFKADCAKCGTVCEVPFRPNGTRPVYCNNCFVKEPAGDRPQRREYSPRPSFPQAPQSARDDQAWKEVKAELRTVNQNLERLISLMTTAPATPAAPKAPKASKKKVK